MQFHSITCIDHYAQGYHLLRCYRWSAGAAAEQVYWKAPAYDHPSTPASMVEVEGGAASVPGKISVMKKTNSTFVDVDEFWQWRCKQCAQTICRRDVDLMLQGRQRLFCSNACKQKHYRQQIKRRR